MRFRGNYIIDVDLFLCARWRKYESAPSCTFVRVFVHILYRDNVLEEISMKSDIDSYQFLNNLLIATLRKSIF